MRLPILTILTILTTLALACDGVATPPVGDDLGAGGGGSTATGGGGSTATGLSVDEQEGLITIDSRSHVTVRGLEVRNFTSNKSGVPLGIYVVGGGTDLRLESNHVHHIVQTQESCNGGDGFGIAVYGTPSSSTTPSTTTPSSSKCSTTSPRPCFRTTSCSTPPATFGQAPAASPSPPTSSEPAQRSSL
jgi:hypothetical protein